jgi:hypothetical protein
MVLPTVLISLPSVLLKTRAYSFVGCTWGQVPLVEFDGKKLAQSLAISRYFAKKVQLVGNDDFEAAECDEYVDTSKELYMSTILTH